ncbi:hypothetical protein CCACVL1_00700, partial [Corchorus capsularis]
TRGVSTALWSVPVPKASPTLPKP